MKDSRFGSGRLDPSVATYVSFSLRWKLRQTQMEDRSEISPHSYQANAYWKMNDHNGVSMSLTAGVQREEAVSSSYEFGGGGDVEGQFGLTPDWMLKVRAGYTHNLNSVLGDFDAQVYSLSLERLF